MDVTNGVTGDADRDEDAYRYFVEHLQKGTAASGFQLPASGRQP